MEFTSKKTIPVVSIRQDNGGIKFKIEKQAFSYRSVDEEKTKSLPILVIESSHFGNQTNQMKIQMTPKRMEEIGKWLINAANNANDWYQNEQDGKDEYDGVQSKFKIQSH